MLLPCLFPVVASLWPKPGVQSIVVKNDQMVLWVLIQRFNGLSACCLNERILCLDSAESQFSSFLEQLKVQCVARF